MNVLWERESPRRFAVPPFNKGGLWREGQIPIPSVSLRSTSPLDKGSRPQRRFGDFAAEGKVTRRPQAAKSPANILLS